MLSNDTTVNAVTCCVPLHELRKNIKNRSCGMPSGGVVILHDNVAVECQTFIRRIRWEDSCPVLSSSTNTAEDPPCRGADELSQDDILPCGNSEREVLDQMLFSSLDSGSDLRGP
ncbi:hypothetical protein TNCV_2578081 [Trichonephila clavipes]|nr:hypothetical protein TNCV_2578081 [Trichonephila clavipes]